MIDWGLATQLNLKFELLPKPIEANSLNGHALFPITHCTVPVDLWILRHKESIKFLLFVSPSQTLVLGHSWLHKHNRNIDWHTGEIQSWRKDCSDKGKCNISHEVFNEPANDVALNVITESPSDLSSVPPCYHHLHQVFSKAKALSLPPHRPYDCPIHLVPGATILYSLSGPEKEAMTMTLPLRQV